MRNDTIGLLVTWRFLDCVDHMLGRTTTADYILRLWKPSSALDSLYLR